MQFVKMKDFEEKKGYYIIFPDFETAEPFLDDLNKKLMENLPQEDKEDISYDKDGNEIKTTRISYATWAKQHRSSQYVSSIENVQVWESFKSKLKDFEDLGKSDFNIHVSNLSDGDYDQYMSLLNDLAEFFLQEKWENINLGTLSNEELEIETTKRAEELAIIVKDNFPKQGEKKYSRLNKYKKFMEKKQFLRGKFKFFYKRVYKSGQITEQTHYAGEKMVYVLFKKKLLPYFTKEQLEAIDDKYDFIESEDVFLVRTEDMIE